MNLALFMRRSMIFVALFTLAALANSAYAQSTNPKLSSRRSKYKVRIESAPPGAKIYLDDKKYGVVGITPLEIRLRPVGWKVILELDNHEPAEKTIRIKRRRSTQQVFIPLVKKVQPAMLEVRADADKNVFGAQVWLDGQLQGTIPLTLKLPDGRHLIEVKKTDFETFTQWMTAKEGERNTIQPTLKPIVKDKFGEVFVEADVPDAEVWIDGNKHPDTTPTVIRKVLIGPHIVEVRKAPAMPWKQTINVEESQPTKVRAELKATIGGPSGTVRVLSNVEGARVYLDGKDLGPAPLDIKDVKPGQHVVEVKAKGYLPNEKRVTVGAGDAQVLKFDLQPEATAAAAGTLKIVSPVPEAEVFIDGERVGLVPQTKDVAPGDHFVVVQKKGYKKFEKKIRLETGQKISVTAELKAVGGVRILSTPAGATVMLDGADIGVTPMVKEDVGVGEHVISINLAKYYATEKTITVKGGGLQVISEKLEFIKTGPTPGQLKREQKGLTSWGARVVPKGRTTLDLAAGFPYLLNVRFTVGAGNLGGRPFDAGFIVRSYLSRTEIGGTARWNLAEAEPFSAGVFATIGGGANFIDDSQRNSFLLDTGLAASLSGLGSVTITGRAYLNFWSDRHCPGRDELADFDPISVCTKYADDTLSVEDKARVDDLVGKDGGIFKRDNGIRAMVSVIVEVAIKQRWNVWALFEGAPFQAERAAFVDEFNGIMPQDDVGTYFRLGTTFKF